MARKVGTTGHEILNPRGQVIGWTATEYWAALIVGLLNSVRSDAGRDRDPEPGDDPIEEPEAARAAINYLVQHEPLVNCTFPPDGQPSEDIRRTITPYLDGIEAEIADLVTRYLLDRLAPHLRISGIEIAAEAD
jgi:hypothetical protein